MKKASFEIDTHVPKSLCCECGRELDGACGGRKPVPGDLTLCIYCASLNAFDDDLKLRKPTDEEYFEVAANSEFQEVRRLIVSNLNKTK